MRSLDIFMSFIFSIIENILFIFIFSKFRNPRRDYRSLDTVVVIVVSILAFLFTIFEFVPYVKLILIYIILLIFTSFYDTIFHKQVLAVILHYFILVISDLLVVFLVSNVMNIAIEDSYSEYFPFLGVISKLLSIIIYAFINKELLKSRIILPKIFNYVMISILSLSVVSMVLLFYSSLNIFTENTIGFLFIICLFTLFISLGTIFMYFKANTLYINLQKETAKDHYYKSYESFVKYFESSNDTLSKIWHDIKGHMRTLENLSQDTQLNYINSLKEQLQSIPNPIRSGNILVDVVLNDKYSEGKMKGIDFDIKSVIPPKLNIDGTDLSSLLFNTIDNGIEACINCHEDNRYIYLELTLSGNFLYYKILNSYNPNISNKEFYNKKKYISSGYGLSIIEDIVDQYDGYMDIKCDDKEYSLTIVLNLSNPFVQKALV